MLRSDATGGIPAASHGGSDDGVRSFLYMSPGEGVAIFAVSNDETIPIGSLVRVALEKVFPEQAVVEQSAN